GIVDLIFKCPDSEDNIYNCTVQFENKFDNTDMKIIKPDLTSAARDLNWYILRINNVLELTRLNHEDRINIVSIFIDERNTNKDVLIVCIELEKIYYFGSSGDESNMLSVPFIRHSEEVYIDYIDRSGRRNCNNSNTHRLI